MNGNLLKAALILKNISLGEFARAAGWDQSKLSSFLTGRRAVDPPEIKIFLKVCARFKLDVDKNKLFPELAEIFAE